MAQQPFTVHDLIGPLFERWRWILGATVATSSIALAWALVSPPVYRAEVLLAPISPEQTEGALSGLAGQFGGLVGLAGLSLGSGNDRKVEAVATLKSRALTEAFVRENDLMPVLYKKRWDAERKRWKGNSEKEWPTLWDANDLFKKKIRVVEEDKRTQLVTLSIEWIDPVQASNWANELVNRTNAVLRSRAIDQAESNVRYLQEQLARTSVVEVKQAIYRLVENEIKTIMLAQGSEQYAFRVIDPAVVPMRKIRPKRALMVTMGFAAGLLFSSVVVLLFAAPKTANQFS